MTDQATQMFNWNEVLARLERAEGPDRELDALIAVASFEKKRDEWGEFARAPNQSEQVCVGNYWLVSRSGESLRTSDAVTSSIDAAIALVRNQMPKVSIRTACSAPYASAEIIEHIGISIPDYQIGWAEDFCSLPIAILTALARAKIAELEAETP